MNKNYFKTFFSNKRRLNQLILLFISCFLFLGLAKVYHEGKQDIIKKADFMLLAFENLDPVVYSESDKKIKGSAFFIENNYTKAIECKIDILLNDNISLFSLNEKINAREKRFFNDLVLPKEKIVVFLSEAYSQDKLNKKNIILIKAACNEKVYQIEKPLKLKIFSFPTDEKK